jgi:putative transposase
MCKTLNVSRSGYYEWMSRKPSIRSLENENILRQIKIIYDESRKTYGSPRITAELKNRNFVVSRPRVARLMQGAQIRSLIRKKFITTTDSKHNYPIVENKLERKFKVEEQGKVWVSDITYVSTVQGFLYLTIIMDLADRKIIGWSLSKSMKAADTTMAAWKMAVLNRPVTSPLIFHSDRGIQYACTDFKNLLESNKNVIRSMSRKGDCWDNAVAESFFKTLKVELIYRMPPSKIKETSLSVFEYIEVWYNRKRLHSTLGYYTPDAIRKSMSNQKLVA